MTIQTAVAVMMYERTALAHQCKFADNTDPLRGIIATNSDPF